MKWIGWSATSLATLFASAQFVRPERTNPPVDASRTIEAHAQVPASVAAVLERSCQDCHSNRTRWPWYSHVAPVSWFLVDHVNHGRRHLNFSDWSRLDREKRSAALAAICKEARSSGMPLGSYLLIHRDAELSEEDVQAICDWTDAERRHVALRLDERLAAAASERLGASASERTRSR